MDWAFVVVDKAVLYAATPTAKRPDAHCLRGPHRCPTRDAGGARHRRFAGEADGHEGGGRAVVGHASPGSGHDVALLRASSGAVAAWTPLRGRWSRVHGRGDRDRGDRYQVRKG